MATGPLGTPNGGGVPPSQALNGTNRWISTELPAAISFALPAPVPLAQIQLTFDTGMHRKLNFNPVGNPTDALHWGTWQTRAAMVATQRGYRRRG